MIEAHPRPRREDGVSLHECNEDSPSLGGHDRTYVRAVQIPANISNEVVHP